MSLFDQGKGRRVKCQHDGTPLYFPNEMALYPAALNCDEYQVKPDFGLYADFAWRPTWRNEFINWPDFRIPVDLDLAVQQIWETCERANCGEVVEVGCIGGHGRTGTILGCAVTYSVGLSCSTEQATEWVRTNYCDRAIETALQQWFISYFRSQIFNLEVPPKPTPQTVKTSMDTYCSKTNHYAMWIQGHSKCADRSSCPVWASDVRSFESSSIPQNIKTSGAALLSRYKQDGRF